MGLRAPSVLHRQSQVASDRSLKAGIVAQPRVLRGSADFWGALSPRLLPADQPKNAGLRYNYGGGPYAAMACLAVSANFAKASGSFTAKSARILRSRSTPDFFRPKMSRL